MRYAIAALLFGATLFLGSCKDDEELPGPGMPASRMTAKVDGFSFVSDEVQAAYSSGVIAVTGFMNSGTSKSSSITFGINRYSGPGTYPIDSTTLANYKEVSGLYVANSGSITISFVAADSAAGTFNFVASNTSGSKAITNGSFRYYR
jgi:hypothetical protein